MSTTAKWLRILVTDLRTGKSKANVRVPVSLANFGLKMAAKYAPEGMDGVDLSAIMAEVHSGAEGKLVEVDDEEKGEHVEVYVE